MSLTSTLKQQVTEIEFRQDMSAENIKKIWKTARAEGKARGQQNQSGG